MSSANPSVPRFGVPTKAIGVRQRNLILSNDIEIPGSNNLRQETDLVSGLDRRHAVAG